MRIRNRKNYRLRAAVVATVALSGGVLSPLAASSTTLYQASNVNFHLNDTGPVNFAHSCNDNPVGSYVAFPTDNNAVDGGVQSNIGNSTSVLSASFDFPDNLQQGSVVLTAPQGNAPSAVLAANAPWGTRFPTANGYQDNAAAASYGCTLPSGQNFYIYNYGVLATFPAGSARPGTWFFYSGPSSFSPLHNQVTIPFNFSGYGRASHLQVFVANVINPVSGTYNGVNYGVLVNDPLGGYSDVTAPSQNSLTFVSSTPDRRTSQLTESIPGGNPSLTATNVPGAGATITATIYDAYYNPVQGEAIYIGVNSGNGAFTMPVSPGGGNGEPVTGANGQASYYAWGQTATPSGHPDTFFGQDTSQKDFYIEDLLGNVETVSLTITAATPNPPSAGGPYTSQVLVYPGPPSQSTTITVDQQATVSVTLVDQFGNPELDHAIMISPILSHTQTSHDFKGVTVTAINQPGMTDYSSYPYQTFACDSGPASEIPGTSCTDSNGHTSFTVTNTKTQTVTFEITDLTAGYTMPFTDLPPMDDLNIPVITFTAGPTSPTVSTVNVNGGTSANVLADGNPLTPATIHVSLRDDKGNPEPNKHVILVPSSGSSSISPPVNTDANGNASFTVTDTTLETITYTATDTTDGITLNGPNQQPVIHFITGKVSNSLSQVVVSPSTVVGDGQGAATVTVTVVDGGGHPLAGQVVGLDSSSYPDLTVVPPARQTDSNGRATFVVRSTSVQNVSLPVDVSSAMPPVLDATADITFTPVPKITSVIATNFNPSLVHNGFPEAAGAGNPSVAVTVSLRDAANNPIPNLTVSLVDGSAAPGIILTTDANGLAEFHVGIATSATNLVVSYTALDVSDNFRAIGTVVVIYVPIPDEEHESTVTTSHASVYTYDPSAPAATQTALITVTLIDEFGDPIVGHDVSLASSSASSTITPFSSDASVTAGTSDASGRAFFNVTNCDSNPSPPPLCNPVTSTFTATDATNSKTIIRQVQVSFVLRPNEATTSLITASPTIVEADGQSYSIVTVTLRNNGALLTGNTVSLSQGSGHAVISSPNPVSNASGQVSFKVTNLTVQSIALQATDLTTATKLTHDAVVTFTAPPGGSLRPVVTAIAPNSGPGSGGTNVVITGSNFNNATTVWFGNVKSQTYSVSPSGTTIVAVSPVPIAAGAVNIMVSGPGGTSLTLAADIFSYTSGPLLVVAGVSPSWVNANTTTQVTISGQGLIGATAVHFGSVPATFTVTNGGNTLTVLAPKLAAGTVHVTVTTSHGTSTISPADVVAVVGPPPAPLVKYPVVSSLSPATGLVAGGNLVTIHGLRFNSITAVKFGPLRATIVKLNLAHTLLTVKVPRSKYPGTVHVTVETSGGSSARVFGDRYTYRTAVAKKLGSASRSSLMTRAVIRKVVRP